MRFVVQRLLYYCLAFLVAATVNFLLPRMMPGDPVEMMFARGNMRLPPESIQALRATFGFVDGPLWEQYLRYLKSIVTGDFGLSVKYFPAQVWPILARACLWTLLLVGCATFLAFIIGTLAGTFAAWRRGTWFDVTVSIGSIVLPALPPVVLALVTMFVLGTTLNLFPVGYAYDPALDPGLNWTFISSVASHATMPVIAVALVWIGGFASTTRNSMISVLGEDFMIMAEAKGLSRNRVMFAYGLRNAMLPSITNLAIVIGQIFAGSLVTEVVFNYPGLGNTLYQAILARDYPLIQGQLLIMTFAMLSANFLADIAYLIADPRLRVR
jgi:peptide/nickel transport system permease protein